MYHTKTELYNLDSDSWEERASYPFNSQIYDAVPIYYKGEFILFGGCSYSSHFIDSYNPTTDQWKQRGQLLTPRQYGHGVFLSRVEHFAIFKSSFLQKFYNLGNPNGAIRVDLSLRI